MFEQFHRFANFYFVMLIGLNFIPQINAFGKEVSMLPLISVLAMQGIKDAYEDYSRFVNDRNVNNSVLMSLFLI
uniref:P-type ATPase N-terminal domain-containing protein n=1 Tax=Ciona intestinalis TaxID=7719 RepID=H2Y3E1_CIOIN